MAEPIKIAIIVDGGMVRAVYGGGIPIEAVILDYDVDGADSEDITAVPEDDGSTEPATIGLFSVEYGRGDFIDKAFRAVDGGDWPADAAPQPGPAVEVMPPTATTGEALRERYGTWGQHPRWPERAWRDDETRLGYWDWVADRIAQTEEG